MEIKLVLGNLTLAHILDLKHENQYHNITENLSEKYPSIYNNYYANVDKVSQTYTAYNSDEYETVEDPHHPDGPDYSSGTTVIGRPGYGGSVPFSVGLDLYPMVGEITDFSSTTNGANKQEILIHLNLFSKKPSVLGGRQSDNKIGHFSMNG